jgi:FSR family fosmidomycin resistance protein-like MFS transporter
VISRLKCRSRRPSSLVLLILAIEFLDEFAFGAREAAWPRIRDDLGLSYAQVGLLLTVPMVAANFIEPALFILGDVWRRGAIVLGGGVVFAAALALVAISGSFWPFLIASVVSSPASGAFVTLSQATLMDYAPDRRERNMARWALAGSIGVLAGTGVIGLAIAPGGSWRHVFLVSAAMALALVLLMACSWRATTSTTSPVPPPGTGPSGAMGVLRDLTGALRAATSGLRRPEVLRWLVLLDFADLMLDVLLGFLALYLVDSGRATLPQAAAGVAVWTGAGLAGDFLLVPLLDRVRGLSYLRLSAVCQLVIFPVFLLVPVLWMKFVILGAVGLLNAGWYAIPQAQLYSTMPGRSGSAMALKNVTGVLGGLFPLGVGVAAEAWGISAAMWLMLAGPIAFIIGIPRRRHPEACRSEGPVTGAS